MSLHLKGLSYLLTSIIIITIIYWNKKFLFNKYNIPKRNSNNPLSKFERWIPKIKLLLIFLSISFIYLLQSNIIYYYGACNNCSFYDFFPKSDIIGLILGVISILISFTIVLHVESNNSNTAENNKKVLHELQNILSKVDKSTSDIYDSVKGLISIDSVEGRFCEIEKVIDHCIANSNDLYVLSYGAIYGQFILANLNVINSLKAIDNTTEIEFEEFYKSSKVSVDYQDEIKIKLRNLTKEKPQNVHFAHLRKSKYKHFASTRILKDKQIIAIRKNDIIVNSGESAKRIEEEKKVYLGPKGNWNNVFLYKVNKISGKSIEAEMIEEFIYENDEGQRKRYSDSLTTIDYVPFQFFLSLPKEISTNIIYNNNQFHAVVLYTDYYNIGKDHSVVSFGTDNVDFCKSLKATFDELVNSANEKNEKRDLIQKFLCGNVPLQFVLRKLIMKQNAGNKTTEALAQEDITARDSMTSFVEDFDIKYLKDSILLNEDEGIEDYDSKYFAENSDHSNYYVIGLLHNPFTSFILEKATFLASDMKIDFCFFKINKRNKDVATNGVEIICGDQCKKYFDPREGNFTYTIFSKSKHKKKWIYIFGGIEPFGTKRMKLCIDLLYNYLKKERIDLSQDTPFCAVYKVNLNYNVNPDLLLFNYLTTQGTINTSEFEPHS